MSSGRQDPVVRAPLVDVLHIRVLVDSAYERFLPKCTHEHCTIEHVGAIAGRQMTTLACEWGLSLHLHSRLKGEAAEYILDFGFTPEIITRNADLLGIEMGRVHGLILSHAHRDHFGGMAGFVTTHRARMRDDLALYVGGEEAFREKWLGPREDPHSWGAVDRVMLTAQKVRPVCCGDAHHLDHGFTTGFIPRNSFETVTGGSMVVAEGVYDHFTPAERRGRLVKDEHPDEHATCYLVRDRGLVVITSCGHVGVINTVKAAMAVSGVSRLHAVVGGFHLGMAPLDYIEHTVDELAALRPDVVLPMHCSGANFIAAMRRRMPHALVTSNVGSRFTFAA
jgi:7,8-dihydropterin-6-yl-methyl-4-(beta-D-ribofuranosyl)aminobenzene 5'-phosphate synthase